MPIDNYFIASQFAMLAKLMDIHGDNSFKSKTYAVAAFNIEKLPAQLAGLPSEKIFSLKGIGDSLGKKIIEIITNGNLQMLEEYILRTPPGILEMLSIKGLGPKKIAVIWKEMEIESLGELLYACTENRLARFKGFGEKSQKSIQEAINFYQKSQGSHLFAEIEAIAEEINKIFFDAFPNNKFTITGSFRRQSEIIDKLEWVTTATTQQLQKYFADHHFPEEEILPAYSIFRTPEKLALQFYSRTPETFDQTLFDTSCSDAFLEEWNKQKASPSSTEEMMFSARGIHYIPPFLRENAAILQKAKDHSFDNIIQPADIRSIIHSHSDWSDGSNTIEQMAKACIEQGYEYLVISDHSKSAFYANGLSEERIRQQHLYVDELNARLAPFRIFKSIECDILNDGALDYSENMLSAFDLVIASIHSNIKMTEDKAMLRLMNAISNPFTTILGHMTGRLLLSRPGYPVNYPAIINACAKHKVAIEINANPRRLDIDWRWIDYALEKEVMLSINPDAHEISEYANCRYGVLAAQKGGLTKKNNLSSFSLKEFENYLSSVRSRL